MKYIINFLIEYGYALWLGASLSMANIHYDDKLFWIISIPTIVLVSLSKVNFNIEPKEKE